MLKEKYTNDDIKEFLSKGKSAEEVAEVTGFRLATIKTIEKMNKNKPKEEQNKTESKKNETLREQVYKLLDLGWTPKEIQTKVGGSMAIIYTYSTQYRKENEEKAATAAHKEIKKDNVETKPKETVKEVVKKVTDPKLEKENKALKDEIEQLKGQISEIKSTQKEEDVESYKERIAECEKSINYFIKQNGKLRERNDELRVEANEEIERLKEENKLLEETLVTETEKREALLKYIKLGA